MRDMQREVTVLCNQADDGVEVAAFFGVLNGFFNRMIRIRVEANNRMAVADLQP